MKTIGKLFNSSIYIIGLVVFSFLCVTLILPGFFGGEISYKNIDGFVSSNIFWAVDNIKFDSTVNSSEVENLSNNLTEDCMEKGSEYRYTRCKVKQFSDYALNEIEYEGSYRDTPSPETVIERGEARCVGKAILFASLLETIQGNVTVEPYYVYQPKHICVYYEYEGNNSIYNEKNFWNCSDEEIQYISKVNN